MIEPRVPPIDFVPTLPVLLRRAVEKFGDSDFLVMPDTRLTFRDADRLSAVFASRLLAVGAGKGTRVGIALPTGVDWVVAWLAVARVGCVPMLFPATYRPAELRRSLRFGDVAILVTTPSMLGRDHEGFLERAIPSLASHSAVTPLRDVEVPHLRSVWLTGASDKLWAHRVEYDGPVPGDITRSFLESIEAEVVPADPLLVVYTSGSSADPKAVVHTHGAAIRKIQPELGVCQPGSLPGPTFCAMPFFWVGGPQDLLGALLSGATIVTQERFDAAEALDLLERERCTSIAGWPGLYHQITQEPTFGSRDLHLTFRTLEDIGRSSRGDLANFGMTETFGPHANREWFDYRVIDPETGRPLPDGQVGEFLVRGFAVATQLYRREREDVFDAEGWYHTGDRGYIEDDKIYFLGRYSEMIKAGGANVAPLEVEQVLRSFTDVDEAFVVGVRDESGAEAVGAIVVPAPNSAVYADDLAARVNVEVSAFKTPTRWRVVDAGDIPLLSNGKPDRRSMQSLLAEGT